jgi:hypothetical protein
LIPYLLSQVPSGQARIKKRLKLGPKLKKEDRSRIVSLKQEGEDRGASGDLLRSNVL